MANDFFRNPTVDEKRDFTDIGPSRQKTPKELFIEELGKERIKAGKKKLPLFKKAAMDDFDEHYNESTKQSLRIHGYVESSDIKPIKMDWSKYSSPDNIEFIEEKDIRDANLSKRYPFDVMFKSFRYKYKNYGVPGSYNMSVMEDQTTAVKRARAMYDNKEYTEISLAEKQSIKYGNKKVKLEEPVEVK